MGKSPKKTFFSLKFSPKNWNCYEVGWKSFIYLVLESIKKIVKWLLRLSFKSDSRVEHSMKIWEASPETNKMNKTVIVLAICSTFMFSFMAAAPQKNPEVSQYTPYNYDYKVEDAEKKLFFDKTEAGDATGKVRGSFKLCDKWMKNVKLDLLKVTGRYSVWLADGRLMIVEYTADLQNGFVPKISFVNNANPITGWFKTRAWKIFNAKISNEKFSERSKIIKLSFSKLHNWEFNWSENNFWTTLNKLSWHKLIPIIFIISIKISFPIRKLFNWIINFSFLSSSILIDFESFIKTYWNISVPE